ncbi:hypothetical protein HK100_003598 [Physocladia obscura]|uniref:Peptide hydrolase n=1 Tax=Physocladia obscura TaxID=109957 RepID=A0AAD5T966_9FUNG|nr:hypothetical protein HK100_003598 [Physocladia obscura]
MPETTPLLAGNAANPTSTAHNSPFSRFNLKTRNRKVAVATVGVLVVFALGWHLFSGRNFAPADLASEITSKNLLGHLTAFSDLAAKNNGTRSVPGPYLASVEYVYDQLSEKTDYIVTKQQFIFPLFVIHSNSTLNISGSSPLFFDLILLPLKGRDFIPFGKSGAGSASGTLQTISVGCSASDFTHFKHGNIALVPREPAVGGNPEPCIYRQKIANAVKAGASAVLLYSNLPSESPVAGGFPVDTKKRPTYGLTQTLALSLLQKLALGVEVYVSLTSNVAYVDVVTFNVLAETKAGDENNVILAGSHLDSVPAGPGINDDSSGSSATLEVALSLYRTGLSRSVVNKVRFAFWSAEELGLIGSNHYVDDLAENNPSELKKIALNLNNDMIASPNGARFIYDGRNAVDPKLRGPSGVIQSVFQAYFDAKKLPHEPTEFDGRSDYGGFLKYGIPAGGLFTGAEQIKSIEQAQIYGGTAGVAFDPCYHLACDTLDHVTKGEKGLGFDLFVELAGSMGHIVHKLAFVNDLRGFLNGN